MRLNTLFFAISILDEFGNVVDGYRETLRFASSDPDSELLSEYTFTEEDAGSHSFTVITEMTAVTITVSGFVPSDSEEETEFIIEVPEPVTRAIREATQVPEVDEDDMEPFFTTTNQTILTDEKEINLVDFPALSEVDYTEDDTWAIDDPVASDLIEPERSIAVGDGP